MTAHNAHTQRVQGIGREYGEDVVLAGSAEERSEQREKKRGRSVRMLPHPRPRRSFEPYLPLLTAYVISIFVVVIPKFWRIKFDIFGRYYIC